MTEPPPSSSVAKQRKWWLLGGAAAVVAVLAVVAVVLIGRGGEDEKPTDPQGIADGMAAAMAKPPPGDLGQYFCPGPDPLADTHYVPGQYKAGKGNTTYETGAVIVPVVSTTDPDARYAAYLQHDPNWCLGHLEACDGSTFIEPVGLCRAVFPDLPVG